MLIVLRLKLVTLYLLVSLYVFFSRASWQILRIEWPFQVNTLVDSRSGKEYLLCSLDPEQHKVFFSIQVCICGFVVFALFLISILMRFESQLCRIRVLADSC